MELGSRKEIVFYYESGQNPNGDSGAGDRPRIMHDGHVMVTDTRLKQTIREYASRVLGKTTLSLHDNSEKITTRASHVLKQSGLKNSRLEACDANDVIKNLLILTHDVPLFGIMLPVGKHDDKGKNGTNGVAKLTGPVQFELGRTINRVARADPQISGRFVGASDTESSTLGIYHSIEYSMIKFRGSVEPACLENHAGDSGVWGSFCDAEKTLFECMWHGTTRLLTRSKYPQRPILYAEVEYSDRATHDDLDELLRIEQRHEGLPAQSAGDFVLVCDGLKERLSRRKVSKFRAAASHEYVDDLNKIVQTLVDSGIHAEILGAEK